MKFLVLLLGLLIVSFLAYKQMYGHGADPMQQGTPKQRLQNVQNAANRIEADQQKAADEALKRGAEAEH